MCNDRVDGEGEIQTPRPQCELAHDLDSALNAVVGSLGPLERLLERMAVVDTPAKRALGYVQSALHGAQLATLLSREMRGERDTARDGVQLDEAIHAAIAIVD